MKIEVIKTENPNIVQIVLNGSEATEDSEDDDDDDDDESWAEESSDKEKLSIAHCWGSSGWQGVIKKTVAEVKVMDLNLSGSVFRG